MWRNPEYFTPNPSLSIDEDLFQPWSPWCIDRGAQASAWRRTTATTAAARSRATTTRSAKGQEDIYEWWGVFFFFPDGGRRRRRLRSGLPLFPFLAFLCFLSARVRAYPFCVRTNIYSPNFSERSPFPSPPQFPPPTNRFLSSFCFCRFDSIQFCPSLPDWIWIRSAVAGSSFQRGTWNLLDLIWFLCSASLARSKSLATPRISLSYFSCWFPTISIRSSGSLDDSDRFRTKAADFSPPGQRFLVAVAVDPWLGRSRLALSRWKSYRATSSGRY